MARAKPSPLGPSGPAVDETNMVFFGSLPGSGPSVHFDLAAVRVVRREPVADVGSASHRWKVLSPRSERVGPSHLLASLGLHALAAALALGLSFVLGASSLPQEDLEDEVVEVSFGFDTPANDASGAPARLGQTEADQEATKTEQQLPQLTKEIAVEGAPPPPDALPLPATEPETPVEQPKEATNATPVEKPESEVPIKETPPPGTKTLTPEELARRMERESRKVDSKEQAGTHEKAASGRQPRPSDLPDSPFSRNAASDIPAPPAQLPSGSLDGSVNATVKAEYASSARNHMRRFWNTPDFADFDPGMKASVRVRINSFGHLVGAPTLSKSSGNSAFDEIALQAVEDAAPFPELPAELLPTMNTTLSFSPQDVKN